MIAFFALSIFEVNGSFEERCKFVADALRASFQNWLASHLFEVGDSITHLFKTSRLTAN